MEKAVRVVCLMIAVVVALLGMSSPGYAGSVDILIQVHRDGAGSCSIDPIAVGSRFRGVCKGSSKAGKCDGDSISWKIQGASCTTEVPNWKLFIVDAPGHASCFKPDSSLGPGIVLKFDKANAGPLDSGPPHLSCSQDKYGTYWPYIVVLEDGSGKQLDSTDPGGIIFP